MISAERFTNPDSLMVRIGLVGTSVILFGSGFELWRQGQPAQHPLSLGLSFGAWAIAIVSLGLALTTKGHQRLIWLIFTGLFLSELAFAYIRWLNSSSLVTRHSDGQSINGASQDLSIAWITLLVGLALSCKRPVLRALLFCLLLGYLSWAAYLFQRNLPELVASVAPQETPTASVEPVNPSSRLLVTESLTNPDVYYVRVGDEYRRQRNYELAHGAYSRALQYNASNAGGHFGLAEAAFWLGQPEEAIRAFEASIRHGYRQPALAHKGIGWSWYVLKQYGRADQAFREATLLDPGLADAYNGLGWVLVQEHECDEAVHYFKRALMLEPGFPEPQQGISVCTAPVEVRP